MIRIALLIVAVVLAVVFLQLAEPRPAAPAPTASQGQLAVPDQQDAGVVYSALV